MNDVFMPIAWVAIALPLLLVLQRWIHTHLHGISLLLTGDASRAVYVYAFVLFPGVVLHELSHWLTARLLGVRTGSLSLLPRRRSDGSIQLGYVEYYRGKTLDPVRESLIGAAPLIVGTAVILLISLRVFGVTHLAQAIQSGDIDTLVMALGELFATPFALLWIYLIFAVSNAMLPSGSDRRAWPAFLVALAVLAIVIFVLDLQAAVVDGLTGPMAVVFGYLGTALSVAAGVDLFFMLILVVFENLLGRLKGVNVVYGRPNAS
jgi:hypothetical protein